MDDLTRWRRVVRRGMAMDRMDPMFALGDVRIVTTFYFGGGLIGWR